MRIRNSSVDIKYFVDEDRPVSSATMQNQTKTEQCPVPQCKPRRRQNSVQCHNAKPGPNRSRSTDRLALLELLFQTVFREREKKQQNKAKKRSTYMVRKFVLRQLSTQKKNILDPF
jgi:hypothetical protein